tara:strand:+ start:217 stop:1260 length:1044 start_codon:yes stop_codon:yes gene_type:complete
MNKEYLFFLKYNLNVLNMFNTIKHMYYKIYYHTKRRISKTSYPKEYLSLREIDVISKHVSDINKLIENDESMKIDNKKINLDIILATQIFHINNYQDIFKKQNFRDPEDYESLHRFLWIRYYFSKSDIDHEEIDKIEVIIKNWCKSSSGNDERIRDELIWEPYTVSERIINIIFFYNKSEKDIPPIVSSQLHIMADYVMKNLEFYNNSYGNHLINNFRAILFYAITFKNKYVKDMFSNLIDQYLNDFIEDGFTKDFSSHYQLLVYFWLYDLSEFAKDRSQNNLQSILEKFIKPLYEKSMFFYSEQSKSFSLFGDISPDLPPNYLISLLDKEYFYNNQYSAQLLFRKN